MCQITNLVPDDWHEDMPDLSLEALVDAERDFLSYRNDSTHEADNMSRSDMPLWIQLELDLWEGKHGVNEQTYWDMAGRGLRG